MSFLKLRKLAGVSWPEIPSGEIAHLWGMYLELERTQWQSPEEIVAGQLAQARHLIAHCQENVPYYADVLGRAGIRAEDIRTLADFRRIPILRRATYRDQVTQFQARALPYGVNKSRVVKTSGTEGVIIEVGKTNLANVWWHACCLRDFVWCGIDPRGTAVSIRNFRVTRDDPLMTGVERPYWNRLNTLIEMGRGWAMDLQQEPRRQLDWLMRIQPDYFFGTPSNTICLADFLRRRGERIPNLRVIQLYSEAVSDDDHAFLEEAFGVPVKNLYSCTEAGYLASPCPEGHGLHVHAENVLLELLNEQGEPCQPGESGRVVLTTLRNHITPFLRYEISDTATFGPERCPCGRGLPLLRQVHGKVRPILYLQGGGRLSSDLLVRRLLELKLYRQHQIFQRGLDHFVIRIVPEERWTPECAARIVDCVQDFIGSPVRVDVEVVERLEMTQGGKVRDVIVEYQPPQAAERPARAASSKLEIG